MKVYELIQVLSRYSANTKVKFMINGVEMDIDDIKENEVIGNVEIIAK